MTDIDSVNLEPHNENSEHQPTVSKTHGRPWRWVLCSPLLGLALWRLLDAWQLHFGAPWSYYLEPPNPILWMLVLMAALLGMLGRVPWGVVKASVFIFFVAFLWIMPPERGAEAAHPDVFLAYEVDRISNQIWSARKARQLPTHPLDLRKQLTSDVQFSYRHRAKTSVNLRIDVEMDAKGPTAQPADRPGVVHVAIEDGGNARIWLRATGLGDRRFGEPAFILEPGQQSPATVLIHHPRGFGDSPRPPLPPRAPQKSLDAADQTRPEDGSPR